MAESLLAHLYSRIRGSQEDVATLSLQYIISSNKKLNEAFNKMICDAIKLDIGTEITYSCQSTGENNERPDMSGLDEDGREVVLCEMKFYAGLTPNQPNAYIERLVKENGKALVFVCPEERRVSLWSKVIELCREDNKELSDEDSYRVNVNGIVMTVLSWAEIIETLRRTAASVAIEALPDIAQLSGFCEMMDKTAFIPFSQEDMGPEIARREERYYQVVDRLFDVLVANKEIKASAKGLKASPNRSGYTRYLRIYEYTVALIYNRNAWMSKTSMETPFWFYFNDDKWEQSEVLQKKLRAIPEYEREMIGSRIVIALRPALDATIDDVVNDMMSQMLKIMEIKV
ncbi:PD-(D/E)XK nuclease superfamily protein [Lachnospiraceae bacterium RM5]|nr:PD-(D/E)XK nuclease superfamily protein [Lachnospiraceae bacterium RM5]